MRACMRCVPPPPPLLRARDVCARGASVMSSGGGEQDGCFHWSVLFLYEEYGQSDFMRDFPEVETIGAALTVRVRRAQQRRCA